MALADRHVQDHLSSAVVRLTAVEQRLAGATDSPQSTAKILAEVRKALSELQHGFADVQELIARTDVARRAAAAAVERAAVLFDLSPIAMLVVDGSGQVVEANPSAVRLLNVSQRHLMRKSFPLFLAADRQTFLHRLAALRSNDEPVRWSGTVRPRECSTVRCTLVIAPDGDGRALVMLGPDDKALSWAPDHDLPGRDPVTADLASTVSAGPEPVGERLT